MPGPCPDPWGSLYLELAVSLGRVLLQNSILFDLIEKLQEADEADRRSSGRVVPAPLLAFIRKRQDPQYSPRNE